MPGLISALAASVAALAPPFSSSSSSSATPASSQSPTPTPTTSSSSQASCSAAVPSHPNKLVVAVGGATALAAGIFMTRKAARVLWSYAADRILGQPLLIRESSRGKYPWSMTGGNMVPLCPMAVTKIHKGLKANKGLLLFNDEPDASFRKKAARVLWSYAADRILGQPLLIRESSRGKYPWSLTGGNVVPLRPLAVTKIHKGLKAKKGLLLFNDEPDASFCKFFTRDYNSEVFNEDIKRHPYLEFENSSGHHRVPIKEFIEDN